MKKDVKTIMWLTIALLFLVAIFTPDPLDLLTAGVPVIEMFGLVSATIIYLSRV